MSISKTQINIAAQLAKAGRKVAIIDSTDEQEPTVIILGADSDKTKDRIRKAIADSGALPLDTQQLEAMTKLVGPAFGLLRDGSFQFHRLRNENIFHYAKTWVELASEVLGFDARYI